MPKSLGLPNMFCVSVEKRWHHCQNLIFVTILISLATVAEILDIIGRFIFPWKQKSITNQTDRCVGSVRGAKGFQVKGSSPTNVIGCYFTKFVTL